MNKTLKVALCDNEREALSIIAGAVKQALEHLQVSAEIDTYDSANALYERVVKGEYDLLLLDIDMPECDGITFARKLKHLTVSPDIIFVSNREERVFDSFLATPFGFIRKSCFIKDTNRLLKMYLEEWEKRETTHECIEVNTKTSLMQVEVRDIVYIESYKDYQIMHRARDAEPVELRSSMEKLEEKLEPFGFMRIHKGYIVNADFISRIDDIDVTLTTGTVLYISRRKLRQIREQYMSLNRKQVIVSLDMKTDRKS